MTQKFRSRLELYSATGRHILLAASDVRVVEELNADYYVTFIYPKLLDDAERYDDLIEDNEIRFPDGVERGQHFVIKRVDEIRKGQRIYKQVEAYHVAFKLGQYYLDEYVDFSANQPPAFLLAKLGINTPFTMAVEGNFANQDVFDFGEDSKLTLLNQARELYGGERVFDNYTVTLTTRAGANRGASIRYRKNLAGITRKSHSMERITRLYGYGKAGLTIEGYGGHSVKYIDSVYFDAANPYEGSVHFPEIDDQAALLAAMQKYLSTVELPKVSYDIDFIELEKVDDEFKAEAIQGIGDTVTVKDEVLGFHFDARVQRYERYPFEPKRGRVTLANFRELSDGDVIFRATVGGRQALIYTSENAVLRGVKYDDSITLVDGYGMAVSDDFNRTMVRLGQTAPGQYGLALYNKSGVQTVWQDAATGDGRFSGKVIAGAVEGGTITGSEINGGEINGSVIEGGEVTGALIQTRPAGSYPRTEMSATGNYIAAYSSPTAYVRVSPYYLSSQRPVISFTNGSKTVIFDHYSPGTFEIQADALDLNANVAVTGGQSLTVGSFGNIRTNTGTLQQALDDKVDVGSHTQTFTQPNHNHGIPAGTRLAVINSSNEIVGAVFWSESGGFTHSHAV